MEKKDKPCQNGTGKPKSSAHPENGRNQTALEVCSANTNLPPPRAGDSSSLLPHTVTSAKNLEAEAKYPHGENIGVQNIHLSVNVTKKIIAFTPVNKPG